MNIFESLRREIEIRIERETRYTLMLADVLNSANPNAEAQKLLEEAIRQNNESLKLINEYISNDGDLSNSFVTWERFVKDRYWNKSKQDYSNTNKSI